MPTDEDALQALNLEINRAENEGDRNFLAGLLAPELAFLRADGKTVDDAGRFLQKVAKKPAPGVWAVETVEVLGNRSIVKGIVTQGGKRFHNIRLFVRMDGNWKLLGWANEEMVANQ
jgi:hypothetical protein